MRKIILEKLVILNFKGIEKLSIEFSSKETNIFGANESGKTSVWDAFNWLITGKESNNSERFPIKRLDKNGNQIQNIDVSVEGFFVIHNDDESISELIIKREFVENWGAEKRGSSNVVFKGNTNNYYWNNAPLKTESEFLDRISGVFGSDETFKILTNPSFFSSDAFDWKKRRSILEAVAGGELTDDVILIENPDLSNLISLLKDKSLKDIKSEASHNKKLLKEEQSKIKTRIEEAKLSKQDPVDETEINAMISEYQSELDRIDSNLLDASKKASDKNDKKIEVQKSIWEIEAKNATYYNEAKKAYDADVVKNNSKTDTLTSLKKEIESKLSSSKNRLDDGEDYLKRLQSKHDSDIQDLNNEVSKIDDQLKSLREKFEQVKAKTFIIDENETICQLCQRPHDPDVLESHKEKAIEAFNTAIANEKSDINARGSMLKSKQSKISDDIKDLEKNFEVKKSQYESEISKIKETISSLETELADVESKLSDIKFETSNEVIESIEERLDPRYFRNLDEIKALQETLKSFDADDAKPDENSLNRKKELINLISNQKVLLSINESNLKVEQRIKELQDKFTEIGQKLTQHDGILFDADKYEQYKFEELERRVNIKFRLVRFKMFNQLQNGGFEPTCLVTYNGVPYVNGGLNTAAKMISGIDIIQTLSDHFGFKLPLFLDNRESCSNIPDTDLQVVNLFVSPSDKKLRVENAG